MKRALTFVETVARDIAASTARLGARVDLDIGVLDRGDSIVLDEPGLWSGNRSCRMIDVRDGWIAANLPREEDLQSVAALIGADDGGDPWAALDGAAKALSREELVARAEVVGMAIAGVSETPALDVACRVEARAPRAFGSPLKVVDFSSLWAGPLCGSVFGAMGADVVKLESVERPDPTPNTTPLLDQRLNGKKRGRALALSTAPGRAALLDEIASADVVITSARARALEDLGVARAASDAVWIAVTGHGYDSARVAFGDDAAASGGLVRWENGAPRFIGDALADPLTGLAAANAALTLIEGGRSGFVDAALARTAAYVAALPA